MYTYYIYNIYIMYTYYIYNIYIMYNVYIYIYLKINSHPVYKFQFTQEPTS